MTIRVLLADDHHLVRQGFAALLRAQPGLEVVAEASDGEEALARLVELKPDVAVVDISMPKMTGIELARRVREEGLATAVVLLSVHGGPEFVKAGVEAGASGYLLKEAELHELVEAIRAAAAGRLYLSPAVARDALGELPSGGGDDALTAREREVLRLVAQGLASKEIAAKLDISVRTVNGFRTAIMRKLGIHTVPGLVQYAIRNHLVSIGE